MYLCLLIVMVVYTFLQNKPAYVFDIFTGPATESNHFRFVYDEIVQRLMSYRKLDMA